jgi:flagellar basal-body rod modification protein FlgD
MTINSIDNTGNAFQAALGIDSNSTKSAGSADGQTLGQDAFLRLMLAQLKNQDPFKPLQSGEFLSQLAQFSTVAGVKDLQSSFKDLSASLVSNQALQASSLLGRSVLVRRSSSALAAGGTLTGAIDVPSSASSVVVNITNASGELVRQLNLGPQAKGLANFSWDGMRSDGTMAAPDAYSVSAQLMVNGKAQGGASVLLDARVESVTIAADQSGLTLSLEGLGDIAFSDVRQIR